MSEYRPLDENFPDPGSLVAFVIQKSAYVVGIAGAIGSVILSGSAYGFNWGLFISCLVVVIVSALLLYGFGELISINYYSLRKQEAILTKLESLKPDSQEQEHK